MGILRTTAALATASAIALLGVAASTGSASASVSNPPSGCTAGNFCFWNNAGYNDGPGRLSGSNPDFTKFSHSSCPSGTWNDCISSVFNDGTSGMGVAVYQDINDGGFVFCVPDNVGYSSLPTYYPGTTTILNDSISSNEWVTWC